MAVCVCVCVCVCACVCVFVCVCVCERVRVMWHGTINITLSYRNLGFSILSGELILSSVEDNNGYLSYFEESPHPPKGAILYNLTISPHVLTHWLTS